MSKPSDSAPLPVPGFERLVWREPAVTIPLRPRCDHVAQIVARGDHAGIVYVARSTDPPADYVTTVTLDGAFGSWPPRAGTPVRHAKAHMAWVPALLPQSSDTVIVAGAEPRMIEWGQPGTTPFEVRGVTFADAHPLPSRTTLLPSSGSMEGLFTLHRDEGSSPRIEHRRAADASAVTNLGELPPGAFVHVLNEASALIVNVQRPERNAAGDSTLVEQVTTRRIGVGVGVGKPNAFDLPPGAVFRAIQANGAGAWVLCGSNDGEVVIRLDGSGKPVGTPWRAPFGGTSASAILPWGDGFILYTHRRGSALIASDGVHATRVEGAHGGEGDLGGHLHTLAASPDSRSILLCHHTMNGIQVLRADFEAASSNTPIQDAWESDRIACSDLAARLAARAKEPRPLPGTPIEVGEGGAPPQLSHCKERIVSQARLRHVLSTISGLYGGLFSRFHGGDKTGRFECDAASDGGIYIAWNTAGLIAIGSTQAESVVLGDDELKEEYFPELPAALARLLARGLKKTCGNASGGFWVTSGPKGRWREKGRFPDEMQCFLALPEAALYDDMPHQNWLELTSVSEQQARLAIALAEKSARGSHTITEEEEQILFAPPGKNPRVKPTDATGAVAAFASIGIAWANAEERAADHDPAKLRAGLAALGSLQVDLLRAVARGDRAETEAVLDRGADIECAAVDGILRENDVARLGVLAPRTPLSIAVLHDHREIVELLLERGANIAGLVKNTKRPPAVVAAVMKGRGTLLQRLVGETTKIDATSLLYTHLHWCEPGNVEVVRILLDLGADSGSDVERERIVRIAKAAGDEELAAKFRKP